VEYVKLGRTGVDVSVLMLGGWAFGHEAWEGSEKIEDDESVATIKAALDAGINWIDTAAGYGAGYSERVVGTAIKGRRDEVILASKCWADPEAMGRNLDQCLANMGIDCIDLYQVHYPSPGIPVSETIGAMKGLQDAGKIRFIGVSNFTVEQHCEALGTARIETSQPPFSVFWREIDETVLPWCLGNEVSVIPYSPLAQGLLAGRYRSRDDVQPDIRAHSKLLAEGILERCLAVVDEIRAIGQRHGRTVAQTALAWTLQVPGITAPIVGCRRPSQLAENLGAVGWRLAVDERARIGALGKAIADDLDYSSNMWGWAPG